MVKGTHSHREAALQLTPRIARRLRAGIGTQLGPRLGAIILWTTVLALAAVTFAPATARAEANGKTLIERKGCLNCHSLMGQGGNAGPPLQATPSWSPPDRMRQYIKDPHSVNPASIMPASAMTDDEIGAVVDYLQSFKGSAEAPEGWKPK
jgi:mono/diheme cytochrome c family protein